MPDPRVLAVYNRYVEARDALLKELGLKRASNRDPLCEFSEWLVATLVEGVLADSPVQKDWDVQGTDGEKIQVKYLANSAGVWVNEHEIKVNAQMDSYAIVIFEALLPQAVVIFPARNLAAVGEKLGKRHGSLDTTLQFTKANYQQICTDPTGFKSLGVRLYLAPDWSLH
jgi:hypothetical protein